MEFRDKLGTKINIGDTIVYFHTRSGGSRGNIDLYKAIVDELDEKTGKVRIWKESTTSRKFSQIKGVNCFVTKPDIKLIKEYEESRKNTCIKNKNML